MNHKLLYWAPGVIWEVNSDGLHIASLNFSTEYADLFPEFYYITSRGTTQEQLCKLFSQFHVLKLKRFISMLESVHILTDRIQTVDELFYRQSKMFQLENEYEPDYFLDKQNVADYREKALKRYAAYHEKFSEKVALKREMPDREFSDRISCRVFCDNMVIKKEIFEKLFGALAQYPEPPQFPHYCYPSAGGLYPIDIYCHVKENRVERVRKGLYLYNPSDSELVYLSDGSSITSDIHFFLNKEIFESSAFSVYLVYNAEVSMSKYKDRAYFYGILEAGIIMGYLNILATKIGLGCCCIGELKGSEIEKSLKLNEYQQYFQCIEFGAPKQ